MALLLRSKYCWAERTEELFPRKHEKGLWRLNQYQDFKADTCLYLLFQCTESLVKMGGESVPINKYIK